MVKVGRNLGPSAPPPCGRGEGEGNFYELNTCLYYLFLFISEHDPLIFFHGSWISDPFILSRILDPFIFITDPGSQISLFNP
jgi:hypothetical protein